MPGTAHVSLLEALSKGPPPAGNLATPIFAHGSLAVEMYRPEGSDPQKPHDRDEVYLIARGTGVFFDGVDRRDVEAGAFLFVAAGQPHRFEKFSSDFACWVLFYGPVGGEGARGDLAQEFASRVVHRSGMELFSADDALIVLARAAAEAVPILGVDGISLADGKTESLIENIADFSSEVAAGRGGWEDARVFIEARRAMGLLFELTFRDSVAP